jgi:CoA-dependent NAD(P)H sulfur oxidoreductase
MKTQRIAVIGGVAAGTAAAVAVRTADPNAEVVLFEAGRHISYSACEMPHYLGGEIESLEELISYTPEAFGRERGIEVRPQTRVTEIDPQKGVLTSEEITGGSLSSNSFDKFILATGARAIRPDMPGADAENVFVLRNLDDAESMRLFIKDTELHHVVVAGAGFVGLEVAEALCREGLRVTIIEPGFGPLHDHMDQEISDEISAILNRNGITLRREGLVSLVINPDGTVVAVETSVGERIGCQMVVLCMGTRPETDLAVACGIRIGDSGGIRTDSGMRTNLPNVWACGDCSEVRRIIDQKSVISPLSLTAFHTGRTAGRNAGRRGTSGRAVFDGVSGAQALRLFEREVAFVGLSLKDARKSGLPAMSVDIRHVTKSSNLAPEVDILVRLVFNSKSGRIYGAQMVGAQGTALRVNVLVALIRQKQDVSALYNLDLVYAPPFSPRLDPLLVVARQAMHAVAENRILG